MQESGQTDIKILSRRMMDQLFRWEERYKVFSGFPEPDLSEFQLKGEKLSIFFRWKRENKREFARLPLSFWAHLFVEIRKGDGKDLRDNLCCKILSGLPRSSAAWKGFSWYERHCELIGRYPWLAKKIGWRWINRELRLYNVRAPNMGAEYNPTYRLVNARLGLFSRLSKANRSFLKKMGWLDDALEKYAARVKVKATDILFYAHKYGDRINVEVLETDELWEDVYRVDVNVDPKTHRCTLTGHCAYIHGDPRAIMYFGFCVFKILGVEFSTPYEDREAWMFSTTGKSIDYGKMTQAEFWEKLTELVEIDRYPCGCGGYGFDEGAVTDDDLFSKMKCGCDCFVEDKDGNVLAYAEWPDDPMGRRLTREEAFLKLARERPGLTYVEG